MIQSVEQSREIQTVGVLKPQIKDSKKFSPFQETAARLLFMAVRWARCLTPFQTLTQEDQVWKQEKQRKNVNPAG